MADTDQKTLRFVIDASGAKRGADEFESAINKIRTASASLRTSGSQFKRLQDSVNGLDFSRLSQAVTLLGRLNVSGTTATSIDRLAAAFRNLRGPTPTAISGITNFIRAVNGIRNGAQAVQNIQALSRASQALSQLATFRAPSAASVNNLQAFAKALSSLPNASRGLASARTLAQVSQALSQMASFRAPSASAIANLQNFAAALGNIRLPSNISQTVASLNQVAAAAGNAGRALGGMRGGLGTLGRMGQMFGGSSGGLGYQAGLFSSNVHRLEGDFRKLENAFSATYQTGTLLRGLFDSLTIREFLGQIYEAGNAVASLRSQIQVTSSGPKDTSQQISYLNKVADDTGQPLDIAYEQWGRFVTAAKMAGASTKDAETVFTGISTAMSVMNVQGVRSRNVFLALTEMFDKQKVQAQQIRRQLGMELPGAMAIFEQAAGKTGQAFDDAMKKGQIGVDVMIKAGELFSEKFASGLAAARMRASFQLNLLENSFTHFKQVIAQDGVMDAFSSAFERVTQALRSDSFQGITSKLAQGISQGIHMVGDAAVWAVNHMNMLLDVMKELGALVFLRGLSSLGGFASVFLGPFLQIGRVASSVVMVGVRGAAAAFDVMRVSMAATAVTARLFAASSAAISAVLATLRGAVIATAVSIRILGVSAGIMSAAAAASTSLLTAIRSLSIGTTVVTGLAGAFGILGKAIKGISIDSSIMMIGRGLAAGVGLAVNAIGIASAALYLFRTRSVEIEGQTATIGSIAQAVWNQISGYVTSTANSMVSVLDHFFEWLNPKWSGLGNSASNAFDLILQAAERMAAGLEKAFDRIVTNPAVASILRFLTQGAPGLDALASGTPSGLIKFLTQPVFMPNQGTGNMIGDAQKRLEANNYLSNIQEPVSKFITNTMQKAFQIDISKGILPDDIKALGTSDAGKYGIPTNVALGMLRTEAGGYNNVSGAGAFGPSQLMPGTAGQYGVATSPTASNYSWQSNLDAGMRYLSDLFKKFGNWDVALAAYNAGPNNKGVLQFASTGDESGLPQQTRDYIAKNHGYSGYIAPDGGADNTHGADWGKTQRSDQEANQLKELIKSIDPAEGAIQRFKDAQTLMATAVKAGTLTVSEQNKYLTILAAQINDQQHPYDAMIDKLKDETDARSAGRRALQVEMAMRRDILELIKQGDLAATQSASKMQALYDLEASKFDKEPPDPINAMLEKNSQAVTAANEPNSRDARIQSEYNKQFDELAKADGGSQNVSSGDAQKLMASVQEKYDAEHPTGFDAYLRQIDDFQTGLGKIEQTITGSLTDAVANFAATGKMNWSSMIQGWTRDLTKFAENQIIKALFGTGTEGTPGSSNGALGSVLFGNSKTSPGASAGGSMAAAGLGLLAGGGAKAAGGASPLLSILGGNGGAIAPSTAPAATIINAAGAPIISNPEQNVSNSSGATGGGGAEYSLPNGSTAAMTTTQTPMSYTSAVDSAMALATGGHQGSAASTATAGASNLIFGKSGAPNLVSSAENAVFGQDVMSKGLVNMASNWLFGGGGSGGGSGGGGGAMGSAAGAISSGVGSAASWIGGLIGSLFSEGGYATNPVETGYYHPSTWVGAPAYSEGTSNTSGGIPAILHDNEAVIPLTRGRSVPVEMTGGESQNGAGTTIHNHTYNISTPDADSFRKSQPQVQSIMATSLQRAAARS